jgi:selenocysteine lyase/cysteine desulfurase
MDWTAWRDEFPVFRKRAYLNTCSLGPLARRVRAAHDRFLDEWEDRGAAAWYDRWMDEIAALRGKFARAIGASPEEVAIAPSVSVALSGIASCLDTRARPKVVMSDLDFPTVSYQWAVKPGVERVLLPSQDRIAVSPEAYEEAIDESTAAVATSHVFYLSGAIQDLGRIARAARAHGALSIIDAYHATGQLPTDVHAAGVDVLVTGGLKWLLGGTGIALLYVRRDGSRTSGRQSRAGSGTRASSSSTRGRSRSTRTRGGSSSGPPRWPPCTRRARASTSSSRSGSSGSARGRRSS